MQHKRTPTKELHMSIVGLARELDTATTKFLKRTGLTPTRFEILEELLLHSPDGLTQADLARTLGMQPANVLMAIRPLVDRGWIERLDKEFNRKEKILTLTPQALEEFPSTLDLYYKAMNKVYCDEVPEGMREWIRRLRIRVNS